MSVWQAVTPGIRLRAIIFDCDGVLFDSWRANVAYYNVSFR